VPKDVDDAHALDPDWILARLREVMPHIERLPGVLMKDVYGVSKRVATRYRDGRVLLAGDSAHVTNTRGGMNMNCGMHDAYALTQAIIHAGGRDTHAVDDASDERRRVATQMLIPRTDRNVAGGDAWLQHIREISNDRAKTVSHLRTTAMLDMAPSP
jgi:2-polyprenyl-6-methoxyphenol hydroxylase-like FAD-dependent oxidoreductase